MKIKLKSINNSNSEIFVKVGSLVMAGRLCKECSHHAVK